MTKKAYLKLPLAMKKTFEKFIKLVKKCLLLNTQQQTRNFCCQCRKYMVTYNTLAQQSTTEGEAIRSSSFNQIEQLVKNINTKPTLDNTKKRKRKEDFNCSVSDKRRSIAETFITRGEICLGMVGQENILENENRLEAVIDIQQMAQIQLGYCGSHQDEAYLNVKHD